jgi:hypothetical protein
LKSSWGVGVAAAALAFVAAAAPVAQAAERPVAPKVREVGPDYNQGKPLPLRGKVAPARAPKRANARARAAAVGETPPVGTVKSWVALDDLNGPYLKDYTLRAVGQHIEVWVANDLRFQPDDCRNGARTTVTNEQAAYLADQFDTDIHPIESEVFSVPPTRDGANAQDVGQPADYWTGDGDKIVTLVDNVRDDNFYDLDNTHNHSYIAGFFYSFFDDVVDRNVMTIDAFDWLHRTGASPPNDPAPGDNCASAPARPFLYESTFAHEYQHLLESTEDPDETSWVNEGLSDWAQTLTGYVDPRKPIDDIDFDSHIQCFYGYLGVLTPANPNPRDGGPENSLTVWEDQGDDEVLCDYGAAYSLMEMLAGRYGEAFMTALHRDDAGGFEGLASALRTIGARVSVHDILRDWAATAALDGVLDRGARLIGRPDRLLRTPTLDASLNWDTPEAYNEPGAPPNGSDYVRLRDARGRYLHADRLRSLRFDGAESLEPQPVEWTVDADPDGRPGDPALFSGSGSSFDRAIVRSATVPAGSPTLSFQTRWATEEGWDFGFVQVSTDGGKTFTSLANADTTSEHDPGAIPPVQDQLPGFTGDSGGWRSETFDLSAYAGQSVLLAFRYVTDSGVDEPGWWIDDVTLGGTSLSDGSTLDGWQTPTQISPVPVDGYTVQLVGYTTPRPRASASRHRRGRHHHGRRSVAFAYELKLRRGNRVDLDGRALRRLVARQARHADVVAVLVMQDDPAETVTQYARYTLQANGVTQPGG